MNKSDDAQNEPWGCYLGLTVGQNQNFFLMGDVFLRNYYAIHDLERARLGLVPHRQSTARVISTALMNVSGSMTRDFPTFNPRNVDPLKDILIKLVVGLFVILLIILVPAFVLTVFNYYWGEWFS